MYGERANNEMTTANALPSGDVNFPRYTPIETDAGEMGYFLNPKSIQWGETTPTTILLKGARVYRYTLKPSIYHLTDISKLALLEKDVAVNAPGLFPKDNQSIGTDPEIFAFGPRGSLIPAFKYLPTKSGRGGQVFWDGYQGELSLSRAYGCIEQMCDEIQEKLKSIHNKLQAYNPEAKLQAKDVVTVSRKSLSEDAEEFVALGCSPSLNAYGIEPPQVGDPRDLSLRFSGCHSHHALKDFSDTSQNFPLPLWFPDGVVVMMDKIAGLCLTAMGRGLEDARRRQFYGRPGEYRLPSHRCYYGAIEYRTPGAYVLGMPELIHFSTGLCRYAYNMGMLVDGRKFEVEDVKDVILNCDADGAWEIISKNSTLFRGIFRHMWGSRCNNSSDATFKLLKEGISGAGLYDEDFTHSWELGDSASFTGGEFRTFGRLLNKVVI